MSTPTQRRQRNSSKKRRPNRLDAKPRNRTQATTRSQKPRVPSGVSIRHGIANSRRFRTPMAYRDKETGRLVSETTWKRSKARGGTRYVRQRVKARRRRDINVLGFDSYVPVTVRSSKPAQLASQHLIAVSRFLRTGDVAVLKPFVSKRVGGVELLTNRERLRELADGGLIKLDALYRNNRSGTHDR